VLNGRWLFAPLVLVALVLPSLGQDKKDAKDTPKDTAKDAAKDTPKDKDTAKDTKDSGDLKWKFEKGKTFYQEMTTKTEQNMTVMGMKITQNQTQTFYFSWTPKEQDKDGNWIVTQKIEGVKMDIQIGGSPITFDSTKDTTATNPLSDFFKALVGAEFTLTINSKNEVTDIKGKDEFLKKLVSANQQMEPLLKQILSDDALKQMADPAFSVVPNKSVKKGDTWEKKSTLNMGPIGSYETTYKYTYEGKDDKDKKLDRIKVDTTLKYTPPAAAAAGALPFKIVSADLKSKDASGVILFDNEKGRVASSEMKLKLEGTLKIDISGMTSDVTLDQTQNTSVKTTDDNPVKKKSTS
jgi:hypothetical protein